MAKAEEELRKTSKSPFDHQLSCFAQTTFKEVCSARINFIVWYLISIDKVFASEKGKETDLESCVLINSAQLKVRLEIVKRMKDALFKVLYHAIRSVRNDASS